MPYCTRCGKPIQEGERCSCTKKNGLNFKFSSDSTAGSLSFGSAGRNPDVQYERGQKIVPDNIAPNESEIPVRQYNLCVMRSRIKGARAEGRLQLTNKRILFRAKGTAPVGETTIQHEFSIDEVAGFQIVRNFRFSILDLLLIFALSVLGQHRVKTIYWILYASCLHIAQFVLARQQLCRVHVVQSDEKSRLANQRSVLLANLPAQYTHNLCAVFLLFYYTHCKAEIQ